MNVSMGSSARNEGRARTGRAFPWLLLASSSLAMLAATSAAAATNQDNAASTAPSQSSDEEGETITVIGQANRSAATVATRVPIGALETPYTISLLPGRVIEESGAANLSDALRYVGTVGGADSFGNAGEFFSSRGFQLAAGSNYFRDGLRYRKYAQVPLYDLDRIEILRGPASIIYGALEPGGVVNFVSRTPEPEFGARARARVNEYGLFNVTGDVTGPLAGNMNFRAQGLFEDGGTFRDHVDSNSKGLSGQVDWRPGPSTLLTARGTWYKDRRTADRGIVLALQNGGRFTDAAGRSYDFAEVPRSRFLGEKFAVNRIEDVNLSLSLRQEIGRNWQLRGDIIRSEQDEDRVYIWAIPDSQIVPATGQLNRQIGDWDARLRGTLGRIEVAGEIRMGFMTHKLLIGGELESFDNRRENQRFQFSPINIYDPVYLDSRPANGTRTLNSPFGSKFESQGGYIQDVVELGDHFVVLAGIRFDSVKDTNTLNDTRRYRDKSMSPQAGLVWRPTDWISPYVSYTRSFIPQSGVDRFGDPFDAQEGKQLEAGLKVELRNVKTLITASAFKLDRRNLLVPDPADPAFNIMSGLQRSKGLELAVSSNPVRGLNVNVNYNHLASAKFVVDRNYSGNTIPNAARHAIGSFVSYDLSPGEPGPSINAGFSHVSKRYAIASNAFYLPAYTLFDVGARYRFTDKLGASVNVRNLFDETYYSGANNATTIMVGSPRTLMFGVDVKL